MTLLSKEQTYTLHLLNSSTTKNIKKSSCMTIDLTVDIWPDGGNYIALFRKVSAKIIKLYTALEN